MMTATIQQVNPAVLMQFPQTVDVAESVRIALCQRGRGPFIGIPCGRKTVLIRRELFMKSLAGLRVTHAELVGESLIVHAVGPRVKAARKFLHQNPRESGNRKLIAEWKKAEARKANTKTLIAGLDKKQAAKARKVAALYAKLQRLTRRPTNPATVGHHYNAPWSNGPHWSIVRWYAQKPIRRTLKSKADLGNYWFKHQDSDFLTKKPWELEVSGQERATWEVGIWGADRYEGLKNPGRQAVKAQLAVLLEIPENEVSVFRQRRG